ncbi:peptide chain release factor N(5)-glutamine methyltransferase [Roseivivax sp. THAF30]|uniref:peptide chain release factor N(5)-glutamine methyltransferase n=1 Tax=Roseivivax sp. THAF30 TaxID=2587852 RepID=UPI001267FFA3|nr:peptide chain release factor N(5)-glutamine methyltransferase [Roseivivax sp. THAF30]QFT63389.1 Release factor glutamine methyltransferase [Roseivivax sp. THAF30]
MTGAELLAEATRALSAAEIPDPGRDARRLLAHVLKVPPVRLTLFLPEPVDPELTVIYRVMVERRCENVPISQLTGRRMFYGREFLVTRDVLDPRPETEILVEAALGGPVTRFLDLGTGSGCIALSLAAEVPEATGIATDLSRDAIEVAFWNRNALGLTDRVAFLEGSWFAPLAADQRFDLIVSNPPYISAAEMAGLAPDVRDHEPRMALSDDGDGLTAYRAIASGAARHLVPGGRLLLEIGWSQGDAVRALLHDAGLSGIEVLPDLDGRDRVVAARL